MTTTTPGIDVVLVIVVILQLVTFALCAFVGLRLFQVLNDLVTQIAGLNGLIKEETFLAAMRAAARQRQRQLVTRAAVAA